MSSLRQGPEPPATEDEYRAWLDGWITDPRGTPSLLDDGLPWPIQRRQAMNIAFAFSWPAFRRACHAIREGEEPNDTDAEIREPLSDEQLWPTFLRWRNGFVRRYQLESLVPPVSHGAPDHPQL